MTDFLNRTMSLERLKTYQGLSSTIGKGRTPEHLYALNIQYSKELYVILGGLEVSVRNSFHHEISRYLKKQDWLSMNLLMPKHKEQVDKATDFLARVTKGHYIFDDVIAQLNYGFWVHLCDRPYEKNLWNNALYKSFPSLGQKPNRSDIERRLVRTLTLRNKIAHLEPIIKNEELLIQEYRNINELLYAICPQTQGWFEKICAFEKIWNNRYKEIS